MEISGRFGTRLKDRDLVGYGGRCVQGSAAEWRKRQVIIDLNTGIPIRNAGW